MEESTYTVARPLQLTQRRRWVVMLVSAAGFVALVGTPPMSGILVVLLVLVGPGTAVVRLIGLPAGLQATVVVVASGLAITEFLNLILMSLRLWSWETATVILCLLSIGLAMIPAPEAAESEGGGG